MSKITIMFQFGGRKYLERIARDFLKESLGEFTDYEWLELDCSNLTIGAGYNRLAEQVKTEYVMTVLDDFGFFPAWLNDKTGKWVEQAMTILENKEIGIIHLRKENDYKELGSFSDRQEYKDVGYFIYNTWDNRGFTINPAIMRTETLKKIIPLDENDTTGNLAEATGWDKWKTLGLKSAILDIPYRGVCFHLGWHRSCCFNYREEQDAIIKNYYGDRNG